MCRYNCKKSASVYLYATCIGLQIMYTYSNDILIEMYSY